MNGDHAWSLTLPVAFTAPKLTPKVTPYGAHARAIPGHHRKRKSAIPSAKMHSWTPSDAGGTAETDLLIRVSLVRSQRGQPIESTTYRGSGFGWSARVSTMSAHHVGAAGAPLGTRPGPRGPHRRRHTQHADSCLPGKVDLVLHKAAGRSSMVTEPVRRIVWK